MWNLLCEWGASANLGNLSFPILYLSNFTLRVLHATITWQLTLHQPNNAFVNSDLPFPVHRLIQEKQFIYLPHYPHYQYKERDCQIAIGSSCNGLFCVLCHHIPIREVWFRLWNPAMGTMSNKLGRFSYHYYLIIVLFYNSSSVCLEACGCH